MIRQISESPSVKPAGDTMRRRKIKTIRKIKKMTRVIGVVFFVGMF